MHAIAALNGRYTPVNPAQNEPDTTPQQMLDAALSYAKNGFSIFQLQPRSKWPMFLYGNDGVSRMRATDNPDHIKRMWGESPNSNLGIATGMKSNCFVLDIDDLEGEHALYSLQNKYGALPETAEVKTGKGRHLYFEGIPGVKSSIKELGVNIDIRGENGYVVAPPSIHDSGRIYKWWEPPPIVPAPRWLLDRVR